jgi:hypothetical protein
MPGVPRELAEHTLEVNKTARPIKQKLRRFAKDRKQVIEVEVCKLLAAGFIKECKHPVWLANPVLVPKKTGRLKMCIDYTDFNKHCPKDPFPLPRIDQVVDSTAGSVLLCFLDCYSGYHQIALHPDDEDKTAFITPHGIYCYKVMTFGLKTAGATYQKAIQKCLKSQIGKNVEAYVDDVVVKTTEEDKLIALTSPKPPPIYVNSSGSSIQPSVSSVCLPECSWASWLDTEALRPTPRRSTLFARWPNRPTKNTS